MVHSSSHNVAQPFLLTWTECRWRERVARHTLTRAAAAALPQQFGNSCRSVASVPPGRVCSGPSPPLQGQFSGKQLFSSAIFILRQVFSVSISTFLKDFHVPVLLQPWLHQHKLENLSEQILKGSGSHMWALLPELPACIIAHQCWSCQTIYKAVLCLPHTLKE